MTPVAERNRAHRRRREALARSRGGSGLTHVSEILREMFAPSPSAQASETAKPKNDESVMQAATRSTQTDFAFPTEEPPEFSGPKAAYD
jgi:hypothetical protein